MAATLFDSAPYRGLFHDRETATLFSDTAELRALLLVMGTLALTQAKAGKMPELTAKAIQRAVMEVQVDPGALSKDTAEIGLVAALVVQFRNEMKAPEYAAFVHLDSDADATAATALALRLRQVIAIFEKRLPAAQAGTLAALKPHILLAYHPDAETRAGLATGLGLGDAGTSSPADAATTLANWTQATSLTLPADTATKATAAALIPALCRLLQENPTPMIRAMVIPQLCLAFACLLPPLAN